MFISISFHLSEGNAFQLPHKAQWYPWGYCLRLRSIILLPSLGSFLQSLGHNSQPQLKPIRTLSQLCGTSQHVISLPGAHTFPELPTPLSCSEGTPASAWSFSLTPSFLLSLPACSCASSAQHLQPTLQKNSIRNLPPMSASALGPTQKTKC